MVAILRSWITPNCVEVSVSGQCEENSELEKAIWSSIAPLSEWSVKNRSNSIEVPDFISGAWKTNQPLDIELKSGGNTKVKV